MAKQEGQIIGAFIFRNEGDGCLTSKYHHSDSLEGPFTEACKRTSDVNPNDAFVGDYRTIWLDDNNDSADAILRIERNPNNNDIFRLFWMDTEEPNRIIFQGSGMLFSDILVGAYWDF